MNFVYTKHAEEKLKRSDVKKFKIDKKFLENTISNPSRFSSTKYGDLAAISEIFHNHDLRIIYDIIRRDKTKIITFHISKKGRYK